MNNRTFQITETNKKTSEILTEMKTLFKVWSYYDDAELDEQFPPPKKITTREFLYSVEPDPETLGKSVKEADPEMKLGCTLRERLLMEILYFKETDSHLDIKGWTICSGSRSSDGDVPRVCFGPDAGEVRVRGSRVGFAYPEGGLRQAVLSSNSFSSFPLDLQKAIDYCKEHGYTVRKIM